MILRNKKNHGTYLSLIEAAMAMKACSTFVDSFALASMKGIPISSTYVWKFQYKQDHTNLEIGILTRLRGNESTWVVFYLTKNLAKI